MNETQREELQRIPMHVVENPSTPPSNVSRQPTRVASRVSVGVLLPLSLAAGAAAQARGNSLIDGTAGLQSAWPVALIS